MNVDEAPEKSDSKYKIEVYSFKDKVNIDESEMVSWKLTDDEMKDKENIYEKIRECSIDEIPWNAKIFFDPDRLDLPMDTNAASAKKSVKTWNDHIKETKFWLIAGFAIGNWVGRIWFGFISDFSAQKSVYLPKMFWILVCTVSYIIFFLVFTICGASHNSPAAMIVLTVIIGTTYGGIFTVVTAYFKAIAAPERVGLLLGLALICMAIGGLIFGTVLSKNL